MAALQSKEEFRDFVAEIESRDGYQRPLAFGIGLANLDSESDILDVWFPYPNYRANYGTAAAFAHAVETAEPVAPGVYIIDETNQFEILRDCFAPFKDDGEIHHNILAIDAMDRVHLSSQNVVIVFIPEDDSGPQSIPDAYLRLHLLSHRLVRPHGIKLDGIFGILPNVAWTSEGPVAVRELPERLLAARLRGNPLIVHSVDKFPRMTDYVVPSGVRIADASRVRLGAHLGEGTTVMHEGFVNFNAGTLGKSMVEGRISAGVVVDEDSDLGGSASIMGTLSGGGKEVISVGKRCLIGANAGIGISLGDDCIVEAGLYVTASTKLSHLAPGASEPELVKASMLSGKNGLLFRRNSQTGAVEAIPNKNAVVLNEALHAN